MPTFSCTICGRELHRVNAASEGGVSYRWACPIDSSAGVPAELRGRFMYGDVETCPCCKRPLPAVEPPLAAQ